MIFGLMQRARAIAERRCSHRPVVPGFSCLFRSPDPLQVFHSDAFCLGSRHLPRANQGKRTVVDHAQIGEEVELLDDHPGIATHFRRSLHPRVQFLSIDDDPALLIAFPSD